MIVKKHTHEGKLLLAVCDEDLLGNTFEENDLILDLTSSFYQGESKSNDELNQMLQLCYMVNAVGEKSVAFVKAYSKIDDSVIKTINNIPYVQIVIEKDQQ